MVVLHKMQNSILGALSLVRPFFRQNGVCVLNTGSIFVPFQKGNVLKPRYREEGQLCL